MDIISEWQKYKKWIARKVPLYHQLLGGPAKPEGIKALEAELGVTLPEDFKQLYLENNGESEEARNGGSMMGLTFLSLQQIAEHWKRNVLPFHDGRSPFDNVSRLRSVPPGAVQNQYFHRNWIPLFTDNQGDYLGLDLAPGPNGRMGQFINFGSREEEHCLIAEDLTSFLRLINEKLKKHAREVVIIKDGGKRLVFGIVGEGHLTDDLRAWTRERFASRVSLSASAPCRRLLRNPLSRRTEPRNAYSWVTGAGGELRMRAISARRKARNAWMCSGVPTGSAQVN